ncbi:MAG: hypothetical protein LUM44_24125 [Pyrinomonadaceae bacterium]|nr:hypothetical protein [Pyrinomonadaceae bacterium]
MNAINNLPEKKNGASVTSLIFGILGLVTPVFAVLIYVLLTLDVRDDGWLAVFVIVGGLVWWSAMTVLSLIALAAAYFRKESGKAKVFATVATALSVICILGIVGFFVIAGSLSKY